MGKKKASAKKTSRAKKTTSRRAAKPGVKKKVAVKKKKTAGKKARPVKKKTARTGRKVGAKAVRKPVKKSPAKKKTAARKKTAAATKPRAKSAVKPRTAKSTKKKPAKAPASKTSTQKKTATARKAKTPAKGKATANPLPPAPAKETTPAADSGRSRKKKSSNTMSDQVRKQLMARARSRTKAPRAAAFTIDDVLGEIARSDSTRKERPKTKGATKATEAPPARTTVVAVPPPKQQKFGAASLADILGYNPAANEQPQDESATIPKKHLRYYKLLIELRDHVKSGLAIHTEDTLKRSSREDSGDLSGYGQHMADAGTDAFDRDFALSLVSNEQEALYEIEEAIKRIKKGTYGVCELTGKPINKDRLLAVPFARYSVESQAEIEKVRRHTAQRAGVFAEASGEDGKFLEDDSE